jgi:orotidine-5'-phosphate decarboxylase
MAELVLALDVGERARAEELLRRLPAARWVKLGPVLFTRGGAGLVESLRSQGRAVFLDLKWHDIPHTVTGAVRAARDLGVNMVTVHAAGGDEMLRAARDAADGLVSVVAVTVLTSLGPEGYARVVGRDRVELGREVERLADLALGAGLDGLVCSPLEVEALRRRVGPGPLLVTPGIRSAPDRVGDQARVGSAAAAARAGASHLVVGRPVLEAPDPAAAWAELAREIAQ